jgi:cbb3-type cytochrome oxidase subunit 3
MYGFGFFFFLFTLALFFLTIGLTFSKYGAHRPKEGDQ